MKAKLVRFGLVVVGLVLGGGSLVGCASPANSDEKACETLNHLISDQDFGLDGDAENTRQEVEAATGLAIEEAASPQLAEKLRQFSDIFTKVVDGDEDDKAYFQFMLTLLQLGEECDAAGVELAGYAGLKRDLESSGLTVEGLERLADFNQLLDESSGMQSTGVQQRFDFEALRKEAAGNTQLAELYADCSDGQMKACDRLAQDAENNSALEQFALACGGHPGASKVNWCVDLEND